MPKNIIKNKNNSCHRLIFRQTDGAEYPTADSDFFRTDIYKQTTFLGQNGTYGQNSDLFHNTNWDIVFTKTTLQHQSWLEAITKLERERKKGLVMVVVVVHIILPPYSLELSFSRFGPSVFFHYYYHQILYDMFLLASFQKGVKEEERQIRLFFRHCMELVTFLKLLPAH